MASFQIQTFSGHFLDQTVKWKNLQTWNIKGWIFMTSIFKGKKELKGLLTCKYMQVFWKYVFSTYVYLKYSQNGYRWIGPKSDIWKSFNIWHWFSRPSLRIWKLYDTVSDICVAWIRKRLTCNFEKLQNLLFYESSFVSHVCMNIKSHLIFFKHLAL